MNTAKQKILHFISLLLSVTGGIMAYSAKIEEFSFLSPKIAQYWPFLLVVATSIDRIAKIIADAIDDGKLNESFGKRIIPMLAVILAFSLCSCAWVQAHKTQLQGTGVVVAKRVGLIALNIIKNAAVSQLDEQNKIDFAQGISTGLRSAEGEMINSDDVKKIIQIWTPNASHWNDLANQLGDYYAQQDPKTPAEAAKVLEQFAAGLDNLKK